MRTRLLNSFLTVVGFWFAATTLWWSFLPPDFTGQFYDYIQKNPLAPYCKSLPAHDSHNHANNLSEQASVLLCWTAPAISLGALAWLIGALAVVFSTHKALKHRKNRLAPSGAWRGISNTIGKLPQPIQTVSEPIELESSPLIDKLSTPEKHLLEQLLGVAAAHPSTFAGDGVAIPWLDHLQDILSSALNQPRNPNLHALVAIAHQLGKIHAYTPDPELPSAWIPHPLKTVDKEAAKILGTLPAWFDLPEESRLVIYYAVKYYSRPYLMPTPSGNTHIKVLATELAYRGADSVTQPIVQMEKTKTLLNEDVHDLLFSTFITNLPSIVFQSKGLPKNVHASAWKVGSRIYLLEHKVRELLESKLPSDISGAFKPDPKVRSRISPVTAEFLRAMRVKGWLITAVDSMTVPDQEALWVLQAGSLQFKGIIILEVDSDHINQIPPNDTSYALQVLGPLFAKPPQRNPNTPIPSKPEASSHTPQGSNAFSPNNPPSPSTSQKPNPFVNKDPSPTPPKNPLDADFDDLQAIGLLQPKQNPTSAPPTPLTPPETNAETPSAPLPPIELALPQDMLPPASNPQAAADKPPPDAPPSEHRPPPLRQFPKPPSTPPRLRTAPPPTKPQIPPAKPER